MGYSFVLFGAISNLKILERIRILIRLICLMFTSNKVEFNRIKIELSIYFIDYMIFGNSNRFFSIDFSCLTYNEVRLKHLIKCQFYSISSPLIISIKITGFAILVLHNCYMPFRKFNRLLLS